MKKPNLGIVTEYLPRGSLRDLLQDRTINITWAQKLELLRSAASGMNYLHSLRPAIVHRDLSSSTLLVTHLHLT